MKLLRHLSLFALAATLALTGCGQEDQRAVAPAAEKVDVKALGTKWNRRARPEEINVSLKEFQSLSATQMDDFINAECDAMQRELGHPRVAAEEYRKTRLLMNRTSVEMFGVGFNKLNGEQFDQVLNSPEVGPQVDILGTVQSMTTIKPVETNVASGKTAADYCYIDYNAPNPGYVCLDPYLSYYAGSSCTISGENIVVFNNRCVSYFGRTRKIGQTDCDFYFQFNGCDNHVEGSTWRGLYGETASAAAMLAYSDAGCQTVQTAAVGTVNRVVLLGERRVFATGGGQPNANNIRLTRLVEPRF